MIGKYPKEQDARWVPPKPDRPEAQDLKTRRVDTVRQIVSLALGHGMEIVALIALLQTLNDGDAPAKLSDVGAGQAGIVVRNALLSQLILLVSREFAESREGDLHLGRAFELLEGDTLAIFQGVGSPVEIAAATAQWQKLRGDHRLQRISHFRDKQTAHLGARKDIPPPIYTELFSFAEDPVSLIDRLAAGTGMANIKVRDNIDAKQAAEAFWKPWRS